MKLNPDCVRNILLTLEESDSYQAFMMFESGTVSKCSRLPDYSLEDLLYHHKK